MAVQSRLVELGGLELSEKEQLVAGSRGNISPLEARSTAEIKEDTTMKLKGNATFRNKQ